MTVSKRVINTVFTIITFTLGVSAGMRGIYHIHEAGSSDILLGIIELVISAGILIGSLPELVNMMGLATKTKPRTKTGKLGIIYNLREIPFLGWLGLALFIVPAVLLLVLSIVVVTVSPKEVKELSEALFSLVQVSGFILLIAIMSSGYTSEKV